MLINCLSTLQKPSTFFLDQEIKNHDLDISINEENIKQVKNIIFLGIVIDEFLTWHDHIDLIKKKLSNVQLLFPEPTFYKLKFPKTDLLCIRLSISYLW